MIQIYILQLLHKNILFNCMIYFIYGYFEDKMRMKNMHHVFQKISHINLTFFKKMPFISIYHYLKK